MRIGIFCAGLVASAVACTVFNNRPDPFGNSNDGGPRDWVDDSDGGEEGGGERSDENGSSPSDFDAGGTTPSSDAANEAPVEIGVPTCAGSALQFDGTGYLHANRVIQDDFTMEAWIKTSASRTGTNLWDGLGLVCADRIGAANGFCAAIVSDKFTFGVGNPSVMIQSQSPVTTGRWVHVAAVRDQSHGEIRILVNGAVVSSMTTTGMLTLSAQPTVTIGGRFTGVIDEVRLWNVARTQVEIASSMHTRLGGTEPALVTYYRFDEAYGTDVLDLSQTGNQASLSGNGVRVPSSAPVCP